jgi:hypothetical protein
MPIADCFAILSASVTASGTTSVISDGKKKLLASIDMSAQAPTVFSADGDYTFTTAPGSCVPTVTGKWKNLANNAGGSMSIAGGRLVANATAVTSQFGKFYWSTVHAPVLGFDIRTISSELLADVNFEKWQVVVEAEYDPMFTRAGSVYTSTVGTMCWANAGVLQGGSAYFGGGATVPTRFQSAAVRAESVTGTANNYPYNIFNLLGASPNPGLTGSTIAQFALNPAPWNSFALDGPTKWGCTYSARATKNFFATSTARFVYTNGNQDTIVGGIGGDFWQNWNPTTSVNAGTYIPTANNDVWAFLCFSRSTGGGATSVKVKAINIYLQEIA